MSERKRVPAVLVYVRCGDEFYMLHRNVRDAATDHHSGKWNGLGGKLEADESAHSAALRELHEEGEIELTREQLIPLGLIHFPLFKEKKNEDWICWVFEARIPQSQKPLLKEGYIGPEGSLHWVPREQLLGLNLWAGDRYFLPWVIDRRPFVGTFWYRGEVLDRHEITAWGDSVAAR